MTRKTAFTVLVMAAILMGIGVVVAKRPVLRESKSVPKKENEILSVSVKGLQKGEIAILQLLPDNKGTETRMADLGIRLPQISLQN